MTAVDCITSQQRMRALLHEAVSHGRRKPAMKIRRAKSPQEDRTPQINATFPIRDEDNFSVPPPKDYHVEDLEYRSEEAETSQAWVPLRIVKPLSALDRLPAIVYLHATGGNLEQMHGRMELAAQRGYLTAAIDCRYHGRRCSPGESGRHCYEDALVRAWRTGNERPFLLDNVWDLTILLDYLETRPDVDSSRIGMTGISLGGMHSWLTMALDDRVAVAAPMIGVQGFRWAAENDSWHARVGSIPRVFAAAAADLGKPAVDAQVVMAVWNRIMPGLLEGYDAPQSLPCLAPRPFLIANGELDPRCPVKGLTEALERTKAAYARAGCAENFQVFFQKGLGHSVSHELDAAVNAFLDKHLLQGQ
ncbi:g11703 [Coccomyxa elongata]